MERLARHAGALRAGGLIRRSLGEAGTRKNRRHTATARANADSARARKKLDDYLVESIGKFEIDGVAAVETDDFELRHRTFGELAMGRKASLAFPTN